MNNPQRVKNRDHCGRELQDPANCLKVLGCGSKVSMQFLFTGHKLGNYLNTCGILIRYTTWGIPPKNGDICNDIQ